MPYYDPAVVYGEWPYPDYPPYYWYPEEGYLASGIIATGIAFGAGYALGAGRRVDAFGVETSTGAEAESTSTVAPMWSIGGTILSTAEE